MKHYLIALAFMLSLNASAASVQPRHRHHAPVEAVDTVKDTTNVKGLEAFSDTTAAGLAGTEDTSYTSQTFSGFDSGNSFVNEFVEKLLGGTIGVGAVLLVIFILLIVFLILAAPFIILILIIRYIIKRHNSRVQLAEKAMEAGQPIPDAIKPAAPETPDYYWNKGIRNVAIGVGLMVMFGVWGVDVLVGVGALIACYGAGQMIIAKTNK